MRIIMHINNKLYEIQQQLTDIVTYIDTLPTTEKTGTVDLLEADIHSVINYIENG